MSSRSSHTHMSYSRVGRRWHGSKGFRLNIPRRFSVQGLRARFFYLFGLLSRWRSSYGRALRLIIRKMGVNGKSNFINSSGRCKGRGRGRSSLLTSTDEVPLAFPHSCSRLRSSNSFYSEAIADCLEFIKRSSSLSVDQKKQPAECQR